MPPSPNSKSKKKIRKPFIPVERRETVRQQILSLLEGKDMSPKDVSADIRVSEKDIYEHLEHIRRTVNKTGHNFVIIPAVCRKCGFVFRKRDRLTKPGKCPVCRGESIREPLFSIRKID